jgi:hypothetical protein
MRGAPGANRKTKAVAVCGRTRLRVEMHPDSKIGTSTKEEPSKRASYVTLFVSDT